jgi:hypothetical protein
VLSLERSAVDLSKFLPVGMVQGAYRIYRDATTQEEKLILPLGSLTRGAAASGAASTIADPAVPVRQFQTNGSDVTNLPNPQIDCTNVVSFNVGFAVFSPIGIDVSDDGSNRG